MDRDAWNQRYLAADLVWSAGPNALVRAEVATLPSGRALDVAAGEGRNALWLAEQGWTVTAVDFSDVAIDKGRRIAERRGLSMRWVVADLTSYEPTSRAFELVVMAYLHLPWDRMERVIGRAAAAVALGGTFLLVGHDRSNLDGGHGGPPDPSVLYTAEQVVSAIGELEVERAERVDRVVQTADGERVAIDCVVRARRPAQRTG